MGVKVKCFFEVMIMVSGMVGNVLVFLLLCACPRCCSLIFWFGVRWVVILLISR